MAERGEDDQRRGRPGRRPPQRGPGGGPPRPAGRPARPKPGSIGLRCVGGQDFELVHPRCVTERELDYQEGIELREAGDPESARDALRYALQGCGDNLWVHVALGRIALEDFRDPTLARGHFGYAFELAERALPRGFAGRLPRSLVANQPLYDAAEGLAACYEALGRPADGARLRAQSARWAGAE